MKSLPMEYYTHVGCDIDDKEIVYLTPLVKKWLEANLAGKYFEMSYTVESLRDTELLSLIKGKWQIPELAILFPNDNDAELFIKQCPDNTQVLKIELLFCDSDLSCDVEFI